MQQPRLAALLALACLAASTARADDYSGQPLNDGATPAAHVMVPAANGTRSFLRVVNAGGPGSPSGWCTRRAGIVPGNGVPGSYEIAAGAPGELFVAPGKVPQDALVCAPPPNATAALTIEAFQ